MNVLNGYCVRYSDNKGNIDVTFFAPIGWSVTPSEELAGVCNLFYSAHPSWSIIDISRCNSNEFRKIAQCYG